MGVVTLRVADGVKAEWVAAAAAAGVSVGELVRQAMESRLRLERLVERSADPDEIDREAEKAPATERIPVREFRGPDFRPGRKR